MNTERVMGWVVWGLAVVVPGGLVLAALWFSFKAAKRRALLAGSSERVSQLPIAARAPEGALRHYASSSASVL